PPWRAAPVVSWWMRGRGPCQHSAEGDPVRRHLRALSLAGPVAGAAGPKPPALVRAASGPDRGAAAGPPPGDPRPPRVGRVRRGGSRLPAQRRVHPRGAPPAAAVALGLRVPLHPRRDPRPPVPGDRAGALPGLRPV